MLISAELWPIHAVLWEELERSAPRPSGLSARRFLERLTEEEDYPSGLEAQLAMLRTVGLRAGWIQPEINRAIFNGVKPE